MARAREVGRPSKIFHILIAYFAKKVETIDCQNRWEAVLQDQSGVATRWSRHPKLILSADTAGPSAEIAVGVKETKGYVWILTS